jgi:two-component system OmpR family sensor kinase
MNSLRNRLTLSFTLLLVAVGFVSGVAAYLLARQDPDSFLDDQLRQIAHYAGDQAGIADQTLNPAVDPSDVVVVQVWDAAGHVLRSTPTGIDLPRQETTGFHDVARPEDRWRTYTLVQRGRTVQASQRAAVREELALNAALPAMLPSLVLIPLSWLLVRWLVARSLRPLDEVVRQLQERGPKSTQPLFSERVPDEVAPLVLAVNSALLRLGEALGSQREFVSDAAHQLRTPITALSLQVQNLKRYSQMIDPALLTDIQLALKRMSVLSVQLLALARAETSAVGERAASIPLATIVEEVAAAMRPLAESRHVTVEVASVPRLHVLVDRDDAATALTNLLDNAVRYTGRGRQVHVTAHREGPVAVVEITDNGPGLPADMLQKVFDRFVRHAEDEEGTGLGLAIAKAVADRAGARISLRNRAAESGLIARIEFKSLA